MRRWLRGRRLRRALLPHATQPDTIIPLSESRSIAGQIADEALAEILTHGGTA